MFEKEATELDAPADACPISNLDISVPAVDEVLVICRKRYFHPIPKFLIKAELRS